MATKSKPKKPAAKPPGKSWRSLMRQAVALENAPMESAIKAKHNARKATALREQAAFLRKAERKRSAPKKSRPSTTRRSDIAAKGWETRRAKAYSESISAEIAEAARQDNAKAMLDAPLVNRALTVGAETGAPVHKTVEQELVEKVGKLVRKKGGPELVLREIVDYGLRQKQIGYSDASTSSSDMLEQARRTYHEHMVSGWLVEFAALKGMHPGNAVPPGVVFQLNSHVAAAIAEALMRAGWTTHGRTAGAQRIERRDALMGKQHTDISRFA